MKLLLMLCLFPSKMVSAKAQITPNHGTCEKSRDQASAGQTAIMKIQKIVQDFLNPNQDYKIYQTRFFCWKKDYPKAINILIRLTQTENFSLEALQVMDTPQLREVHFEEAIRFANYGNRFNHQIITFYRFR